MAFLQALAQRKAFRWTLTLIWTLLLCIVLVQPAAQPIIPTGLPPGPKSWDRELFFNSMHLLGFCLLMLAWYAALSLHMKVSQAQIGALLVGLILGASTEMAQSLTPDRNADPLDFLANVAGLALGLLLIMRTQRRKFQNT